MATWKKDILSSLFFMLCISIFFYGGRTLKADAWSYPRLLLILLIVCVAFLLVRGIRNKLKETAEDKAALKMDAQAKAITMQTAITLGGCSLAIVLYIIAIEYLGYLPSSSLFIASVLFYLRIRKWWVILGVSLGISAFIYFMFNNLLMILLPSGIFFS